MKFSRYPKIFRIGHEETQGIFDEGYVTVEEKVDGANVRWMYDPEQDRIRFGSRNRELTDLKDFRQFKKFGDWVRQLDPDDLVPGNIYYAEFMIPHTIPYNWRKTPMLVGFDVFNGVFMNHEEAIEQFKQIDVEFVPVIDVIKADEIDERYLEKVIPESRYYSGVAEGVVFKNYKLQKFTKLVSEGFREINQQVFGKGKKYARSPEEFIIEKYIPPRRVEKVVYSLMDEGFELNMKLMNELPKRVWNDVVIEEGANILNENLTINLKKLRKTIPKRCVNVIQRLMALKEVGAL